MKTLISLFVLALAAFAQQPPVRSLICEPSSASGTTYTCTGAPTLAAYTTGMRMQFKADVANTGAVTVNVDTLGAKAITKLSGAVNTALSANDIRAGQYVICIYDGTQFQMLSQTGNAASSGGAGTMSSMVQATLAASTTGYYGPFGVTTSQTSGNYARVSAPWPVACTAQKLYVSMGSAQGTGGGLAVTLYKNGATSALTCTVASGATTCNDTSNTVSVAAGDLIAWQIANGSGAAASTNFNVAMVCQ